MRRSRCRPARREGSGGGSRRPTPRRAPSRRARRPAAPRRVLGRPGGGLLGARAQRTSRAREGGDGGACTAAAGQTHMTYDLQHRESAPRLTAAVAVPQAVRVFELVRNRVRPAHRGDHHHDHRTAHSAGHRRGRLRGGAAAPQGVVGPELSPAGTPRGGGGPLSPVLHGGDHARPGTAAPRGTGRRVRRGVRSTGRRGGGMAGRPHRHRVRASTRTSRRNVPPAPNRRSPRSRWPTSAPPPSSPRFWAARWRAPPSPTNRR